VTQSIVSTARARDSSKKKRDKNQYSLLSLSLSSSFFSPSRPPPKSIIVAAYKLPAEKGRSIRAARSSSRLVKSRVSRLSLTPAPTNSRYGNSNETSDEVMPTFQRQALRRSCLRQRVAAHLSLSPRSLSLSLSLSLCLFLSLVFKICEGYPAARFSTFVGIGVK